MVVEEVVVVEDDDVVSCRLNPPINIYKRELSSSPKSPPHTPLGVQRYGNNGQDQRA